ncbi:MAG TPA: DUF3662 and FHA domain-containing protein [Acidimicrobiales bacterium]|nr:DUF3662 and FHA domain-containing protein [Acidimicrobiales bacterium]
MGLQQFEQRLERLVEGVFARAFRGGLQPVELGRRLTREMDLERTVGVRGLVAPNRFTVVLSPADEERFSPFADALLAELADAARQHARDEHYHFLGPVHVDLAVDRGLAAGVFQLRAETEAGPAPDPILVLPDGRRYVVRADSTMVGRATDCAVVLDDPNVSRHHALLRRDGPVTVIEDQGSTNGTKVNGTRLSPRQGRPLEDGDEITIGSNVLRFETL